MSLKRDKSIRSRVLSTDATTLLTKNYPIFTYFTTLQRGLNNFDTRLRTQWIRPSTPCRYSTSNRQGSGPPTLSLSRRFLNPSPNLFLSSPDLGSSGPSGRVGVLSFLLLTPDPDLGLDPSLRRTGRRRGRPRPKEVVPGRKRRPG